MTATSDDRTAADREIVISRHIDAPPETVFAALTDPEHLDRWWGPAGFTVTTHAFELRIGGTWEYTMHGPDGTDYPNRIEWQVIEPPARLVYLHGEGPDDPDTFTSTLAVDARDTGSEVSITAVFPTRELRDRAVEEYHAVEGGHQTLDSLAEHLAAADSATGGRTG